MLVTLLGVMSNSQYRGRLGCRRDAWWGTVLGKTGVTMSGMAHVRTQTHAGNIGYNGVST